MDKGDGASTTYEFTDDIANFHMDKIEENPEWIGVKLGHVHSHHAMGVFFSGTDTEELMDNVNHHNFYLSLIVNNFGEMIAKLVYKITPCAYEAFDENGGEYEIGALGHEKPLMVSLDCIIITPEHEKPIFEPVFENRVNEIIKKADNRPKPVPYVAPKGAIAQAWDKGMYGQSKKDSVVTQMKPKSKVGGNQQGAKVKKQQDGGNPTQNAFDRLTNPNLDLETYSPDTHVLLELTKFDLDEKFACFCVRFGEYFKGDDLEQALAIAKDEGVDGVKLTSTVIDNLTTYYDKFMNKMLVEEEVKDLEMNDFLSTIENVVDNLGDYEGKYPFVGPLMADLQALVAITKKNWREAVPNMKPKVKEVQVL